MVYQLDRLLHSKRLDRIVLATSTDSSDDTLAQVVSAAGFRVFRGDLHNVLDRFRACSVQENATNVIRLTGDCPLSDPVLIDELIYAFIEGGWDYLANCSEAKQLSVPDGFDVEVFRADLLERAASQAALPSELEHVTPWFRKDTSGLNWGHYQHRPARPYYRVSVDDVLDLEVVRAIVEHLHSKNSLFGVDDVVDFLDCHPEIASNLLLCEMRDF